MADIKVVLSLDQGNVPQGSAAAAAAIGKIGTAGQVSAAQTAAAMRTLPAQFTDIATQLQGGASPLTILLQQGGQIKDSFGGIGPALRGIGSAITPVTVALGIAGTAIAGVVGGFIAGRLESAAFTRSMALTGNVAGVSAGQIDRLSQTVSDSRRVTIGTARDITAALVNTGKLSGAALDSTANAAAIFARVSGESADDVAKSFGAITDGVTQWAQRANTSYNFLTAAQFAQIKSLESQGRAQEAVRITMDALAGTMQQRLTPAVGALERGWDGLKTGVSSLWDLLKGFGRDETAEDRIGKLAGKVSMLQGIVDRANKPGGGMLDSLVARLAGSFVPDAQAELDGAQAEKNRADLRRADNAIALKTAQGEIEAMSAAHQSALAGIDKAGAALRLAQTGLTLTTAQTLYENAYARGQVTAEENAAALKAIGLARIDAELQQVTQLRAIEARRQAVSPDDRLAQQAALTQMEAQRLGLQEKRTALALKEFDSGPALGGVNLFDTGGNDGAEIARIDAARKAGLALQADSRALATAMLTDDRARGQAQIELDAQLWRERLDAQALGDDARREAENDLANYVLLRNQQLAEQLKPQWQRMVEGWGDTTRLMRESTDEMMAGLVKGGEDAFVRFGQTGRLNIASLVQDLQAQFLRLGYRQLIGSDTGQGALGAISSFVKPGSQAKEGDAGFIGPLQDLASAAGDTSTRLRAAGDASAALDAQAGVAGAGLGRLGNTLFSAIQSVLGFVSSLQGKSASQSFGGLVDMLAGGSSDGTGASMSGSAGMTSADDWMLAGLGAGRANGGPVYPQTLHPVNERGVPELLTSGGRQYLMTGPQGGMVTPLSAAASSGLTARSGGSGGGGGGAFVVNLTLAPNINIDARSDQAQVAQMVQQGMQQAAAQAQAAVLDTMRRNRAAFRT